MSRTATASAVASLESDLRALRAKRLAEIKATCLNTGIDHGAHAGAYTRLALNETVHQGQKATAASAGYASGFARGFLAGFRSAGV